jgi:hypothetical protein
LGVGAAWKIRDSNEKSFLDLFFKKERLPWLARMFALYETTSFPAFNLTNPKCVGTSIGTPLAYFS